MKAKKINAAEYREVLRIDLAYVQGISDQGMNQGKVLFRGRWIEDSDDLRLCIELSGGSILLMPEQRFYISKGWLVIEEMVYFHRDQRGDS